MSDPALRTPLIVISCWAIILGKCALVIWAVDRWQVPINAGWIVWPTLVAAALATIIWLRKRD